MEYDRKQLFTAALIFFTSAAVTFYIAGEVDTSSNVEQLDFEVNSSNEIAELNFQNRSVDVMLENTQNATFYIDRDRDGSADETIQVISDGEIHQRYRLFDFPENVYRMKIKYQDSPEESGDAWMRFESVEPLK